MRYPELRLILQWASPTTPERDRCDLRYRVRMLGLSPSDTAVALGLLADAFDGDERMAA
jgi:hypothetical protein